MRIADYWVASSVDGLSQCVATVFAVDGDGRRSLAGVWQGSIC